MASSGALAADVAAALHLSPVTVAAYLKTLRENELIRTSGRGTSAAHMEIGDSVALLIACLASPTIGEAPAIVRQAKLMKLVGESIFRLVRPELDHVNFTYTSPHLDHDDFTDTSHPNDLESATTFFSMLYRLIWCAEVHLQKLGNDQTEGWTQLFNNRWNCEPVTITYCNNNATAYVDLRTSPDYYRRFIYRNTRKRADFELDTCPLDMGAKLSNSGLIEMKIIATNAILATAKSLLTRGTASRGQKTKP